MGRGENPSPAALRGVGTLSSGWHHNKGDKDIMEQKIFHRIVSIQLERKKDNTVSATLSTETPVVRPFGVEILDHGPRSVDLERTKSGLPLLFNHQLDSIIGRVENVRIEDRRLRGTLRPGSSALAVEKWKDIEDGILQDVSISYELGSESVKEGTGKDGDIIRFFGWKPLEASVVTVPADPRAGIGRSFHQINNKEKNVMDREILEKIDSARREGGEKEANRVKEIVSIATRHADMDAAMRYINSGASLDEYRAHVLKKISNTNPLRFESGGDYLGMSGRELRDYSIVRALRALINNDWSQAGLEREASLAVAQNRKKDTQGFFIPCDLFYSRSYSRVINAINKTTVGEGGYMIGVDHRPELFVDLLSSNMMVARLGATVLPGLVGDVDIPKLLTGSGTYWVAEDTAVTQNDPTFGQVTLAPKTVGALTCFTRKMLLQSSPAIEELVRIDLARSIGLAIDAAAINGNVGAGEPRGILSVVGIGSVACGAPDGGYVSIEKMVDLETEVSQDNALNGSLGYLTNSKIAGYCKQTPRFAGDLTIWEPDPKNEPGFGVLNGYRAGISNQVPSTLTKGGSGAVLSAVIFGDWSSLLIGNWGVLEILVNPYESVGFTKGNVFVRALQDVDIAVRHAQSFAAIVDAKSA